MQPFASVTVTVYKSGGRFSIGLVVPPFDQSKLKGSVPPTTVKVSEPSDPPTVETFTGTQLRILNSDGSSTTKVNSSRQPMASVAIILYTPEARSVWVTPVANGIPFCSQT